MTKPQTGGIQAIDRTFEIVEALNELEGAGVSELARYVGLPKSTVYNHLATLEQTGYVVRRDGEYRTGLKFLEAGELARDQHKLYTIGRSEVDKLAEKTGEISGLMTEEHGTGVVIYRSRGSEAALIDTHIGDRIPLHCTALGKAILAFLPESQCSSIVDDGDLEAFTTSTITEPTTLHDELEEVRENKIAFDDEERLNGLRSVAAPILDGSGSVIGAISVAGPTHRMRGERFRTEFPELALGVANVIELNLQHS